MKKNYFIYLLMCVFTITLNAQTDNFENYTQGDVSAQSPHWRTWSAAGGATEDADVVDYYANSGSQSLLIDGSTSVDMLYLVEGAPNTGITTIQWQMYIPTGQSGYFNMQAALSDSSSNWEQALMGGNVYFNCGATNAGLGSVSGAVDCSSSDQTFIYPEDEWFKIDCIYDNDNQTWGMKINDVEQFTGHTYEFGSQVFEGLAGIDFYSASSQNEYYIDDIVVNPALNALSDLQEKGFSLFPNPTTNNLVNFKANEEINQVTFYNVIGQQVKKLNLNSLEKVVDISNLVSGTYFVKVNIGDTVGTIKLIK